MNQSLNYWWPIGVLAADDVNNGLLENDLVYIVDSAATYSSDRIRDFLKHYSDAVMNQELLLEAYKQCIRDENSPHCVICTRQGRIIKVAKEVIRIMEPDEFEAIVFSHLICIDKNNLETSMQTLKFYTWATAPYIESAFSALYSGITHAMASLQTASFHECEQQRVTIGLMLKAFHSLLHHRNVDILVSTALDSRFTFEVLNKSRPLSAPAFSEVALVTLQELFEQIQKEQESNPCFYFDKEDILEYIRMLKDVGWLYPTLFAVFRENSYRKAAVRKAFGAMEQFHENKQIRTNKAFFLPNGIKYGKILVTSFIEAIINAPPQYFDIYLDGLCFFLCLEPSLMLTLEDEQFRERVIPVINNALEKKGSRRNETLESLLAKPNVAVNLEMYYTFQLNLSSCFLYREKMFCTLICKTFGQLELSPQLVKTVVLAPPAEYDKTCFDKVKPYMRVSVHSLLLDYQGEPEECVPFYPYHECYDYNNVYTLPRGFLQTWVTNDAILKQHLLTIMDNEGMHLGKYVAELIHDDESKAKVFYECMPETNQNRNYKVFENIWHSGVWWYLLIVCLEKCQGVRALFPAERVHKNFAHATSSLISFSTLQYYYHKLKDNFNEKQQQTIEKSLKAREDAEDCFTGYLNGLTDYSVDTKFQKFAKSHAYVYFTCFIHRFMNQVLKEADVHLLEKDLILFRDTAFQVPQLRARFADMNFKEQMGILVRSTISKRLPQDHVKHIFNYTWSELHATDMIGRAMLQQYEKSSIALNPEALGKGRFGTAYLAKVPYCPDEVVVKIATTSTAVEKLRDIGYEIDGLMRTLYHPRVLSIFGYVVEDGDYVGIVMEYCKGGTVQNVIDDPNEIIDEKRTLHWTIQAASGLIFLHQHDIIHRDVNPNNMLLDQTKTDLKLSDFGISIIPEEEKPPAVFKIKTSALTSEDRVEAENLGISEAPVKGMSTVRGTQGYRAPDSFTENYTISIDVFSLGRSVWAMVYRRNPDDVIVARTWGDSSGFNGEVPVPKFSPSDELRRIASRMMADNVELRLNMATAYKELVQLNEK